MSPHRRKRPGSSSPPHSSTPKRIHSVSPVRRASELDEPSSQETHHTIQTFSGPSGSDSPAPAQTSNALQVMNSRPLQIPDIDQREGFLPHPDSHIPGGSNISAPIPPNIPTSGGILSAMKPAFQFARDAAELTFMVGAAATEVFPPAKAAAGGLKEILRILKASLVSRP